MYYLKTTKVNLNIAPTIVQTGLDNFMTIAPIMDHGPLAPIYVGIVLWGSPYKSPLKYTFYSSFKC